MHKSVEHYHEAFATEYTGMSVQEAPLFCKIPKSMEMKTTSSVQVMQSSIRTSASLKHKQEALLEKWILNCGHTGYPVAKLSLIALTARDIFTEAAPQIYNEEWFRNYCKRHPRVAEATVHSLKWLPEPDEDFEGDQLRSWFQEIGAYLYSVGVEDVRQKSERVFHFMYRRYCTMSCVMAFSAACQATPPMLVLPHGTENLSLPKGWARYYSANPAVIDDHVILYYLEHVLHRYLESKNAEFPVIVYMGYRRKPLGIKVLNLCARLRIVQVNLYPEAFKTLYEKFTKNLEQWQSDMRSVNYSDEYTRGVESLKFAIGSTLLMETMKETFRKYGIYPFDLTALKIVEVLPLNLREEKFTDIGDGNTEILISQEVCDEKNQIRVSRYTYICDSI